MDADTKWAALEVMLASSVSAVALAKKVTKPGLKTVARTISIPINKVIKQPVQKLRKPAANDAVGISIQPTISRKPLPNQ